MSFVILLLSSYTCLLLLLSLLICRSAPVQSRVFRNCHVWDRGFVGLMGLWGGNLLRLSSEDSVKTVELLLQIFSCISDSFDNTCLRIQVYKVFFQRFCFRFQGFLELISVDKLTSTRLLRATMTDILVREQLNLPRTESSISQELQVLPPNDRSIDRTRLIESTRHT